MDSLEVDYLDRQGKPLLLENVFNKATKSDFTLIKSILNPSVDMHSNVVSILKTLHSKDSFNVEDVFKKYSKYMFENNCHQYSFAFAFLSGILGIKTTLLECYGIQDLKESGNKIIRLPPEDRFSVLNMNHNPHCLVGFEMDGKEVLISPKHFKLDGDSLTSVLDKSCHERSIYIKRVLDGLVASDSFDQQKFPVWIKLKKREKESHYYKAFERREVNI